MNFLSYFVFTSKDIRLGEDDNEGIPLEMILSNEILTIILLSHCYVPSQEIAEKIKSDYSDKIQKNVFMNKNDLIQMKFWFENDDEFLNDVNVLFSDEKNPGYNKLKKIKEILFDLNKLNDEEINIDIFIGIITLKNITKQKIPKSIDNIEKYIDMFYP